MIKRANIIRYNEVKHRRYYRELRRDSQR